MYSHIHTSKCTKSHELAMTLQSEKVDGRCSLERVIMEPSMLASESCTRKEDVFNDSTLCG